MAQLIKKYNKTKFQYSEGEQVEKDLYNYIKDRSSDEYEDILGEDDRWTVFYHLSDIRKGILTWYPFNKNGNCLEIGGGLGAITDLLCEKCKKVTTIEMSEIRADTLYNRHKDIKNLDIYVGDIKDIRFKEKFDYIVLIGVLEYQGRYSDTTNPYISFLKFLKTLLKPNGKILLAIENRFGLKYWCGTKEDHTAIPFDGINNYKKSKLARTFGKNELNDIILKSGFKNTKFYYPLPDYKLPNMVFTDDYLPKNDINNRYREYYLDYWSLVLDEIEILPEIINNKVFPFFANSFLVECSDSKCSDIKYVTSTYERKKELQLATIIENDHVEKIPLNKKAINEINIMAKNLEELKVRGINTIDFELKDNRIIMNYIKDKSFDSFLLDKAKEGKIDIFKKSIKDFYQLLLKTSELSEKNYLIENKILKNYTVNFGPILKKGYIDFLFHNSFITKNGFMIFDQEFVKEDIPATFMIYRSLKNLYYRNDWLQCVIPIDDIYTMFDMSNVIKYYDKLDGFLLGELYNSSISTRMNIYHYNDTSIISRNQDILADTNRYSNLEKEIEILRKDYANLMKSHEVLINDFNNLGKTHEAINNLYNTSIKANLRNLFNIIKKRLKL